MPSELQTGCCELMALVPTGAGHRYNIYGMPELRVQNTAVAAKKLSRLPVLCSVAQVQALAT